MHGSVKEQMIDERMFVHVWCMMNAKWKDLGMNVRVWKNEDFKKMKSKPLQVVL